ncbi:TonB-dependent receptor domain-containing protein [Aquimarina muelleri]|uniref:TonB-dependent receptor n=1 Tax=Aquimarina muelleri TaxID=279356 RepID=A0A918N360_9FLAO|nr:TonB-dependent receptor [Aquimarina muelleri]MCX2761955.1 carboxypeptidase-like regulatory domain-containing protein [Aquimarina muelleri]GGX10646.1 TonB-dependent receptor [Aquimarina muelleri]
MKLKDYNIFFVALLIVTTVFGQHELEGKVIGFDNQPIANAEVYIRNSSSHTITNSDGEFKFTDLKSGEYWITIFSFDFEILEEKIKVERNVIKNFVLNPLGEELSEVLITQRKEKIFGLKQLKPVEGTAIFAGKKSEVVLVDQTVGNLAANNARQIYAQVVGLNIYENSVGGLQLNIGGRGLDPNRTANFNTRQNGYDISADVLGYPESYYTPPAEALSEIQVVRGAASLQYGTQFGGLINFKLKQPNPNKKIELISRQSLGSYNLFTSFNSLGGTVGKLSYYTYFNYKEGKGFRPNTQFDSKNLYVHLGYQISKKTKISGEFTYLNYLAQQPGGLSDARFKENPSQSNRTRNWFKVDWKLFSLRFDHKLSDKTDISLNLFGLDASRSAVGFRTNRVDQEDQLESPRDLIVGDFLNFGAEGRVLSRYNLFGKESIFLIGTKYYQANNAEGQGPGTADLGSDFDFTKDKFPTYPNQSDFDYPNLNVAVFGENIFNITNTLSVTPGFRFEYLKTEVDGSSRNIITDLAGNVIRDNSIQDNRTFERSFVLLGLGISYKPLNVLEIYANISENYRSVTFSDINIVNPSFRIDPDITDESGFTSDVGIRGKINDLISYDVGLFGLFYNNRIGVIQQEQADGSVKNFRTNVGDATMYGLESLVDFNLNKILLNNSSDISFNWFANTSLVNSKYNGTNKEVEFVPNLNMKTGLRFGYKNLLASVQYSYLSEQFSDAENSVKPGLSGVRGLMPAYDIMDFSLSYSYKIFKLETGINNILDKSYFTQRATGYPGPGIIPSEPLTWYTTLQFRW